MQQQEQPGGLRVLKKEPVWQECREIGGRGLGGSYEWWPVDQTGNLEF